MAHQLLANYYKGFLTNKKLKLIYILFNYKLGMYLEEKNKREQLENQMRILQSEFDQMRQQVQPQNIQGVQQVNINHK
jgi:hypothetical protein